MNQPRTHPARACPVDHKNAEHHAQSSLPRRRHQDPAHRRAGRIAGAPQHGPAAPRHRPARPRRRTPRWPPRRCRPRPRTDPPKTRPGRPDQPIRARRLTHRRTAGHQPDPIFERDRFIPALSQDHVSSASAAQPERLRIVDRHRAHTADRPACRYPPRIDPVLAHICARIPGSACPAPLANSSPGLRVTPGRIYPPGLLSQQPFVYCRPRPVRYGRPS
jgi:hypothetical protein